MKRAARQRLDLAQYQLGNMLIKAYVCGGTTSQHMNGTERLPRKRTFWQP